MHWDDLGQGLLFAPVPQSENDTRLWRQFRDFDERNPQIWEEFEKRTVSAIQKGLTKLGAKLVIETIRWDEMIGKPKNEEFKICNNHHPYYARKFMLAHPEFRGVFELRKVRSK